MVSTSLSVTLPSQVPILIPTNTESNPTQQRFIDPKQIPPYPAETTTIPNYAETTKLPTYSVENNGSSTNVTDKDNRGLPLYNHPQNLPNPNIEKPVLPDYTLENNEMVNKSEIAIPNVVNMHQSELYADYLCNPYNDAREVSPKEATIYDPEINCDPESLQILPNPKLLSDKKSISVTSSPMHKPVVQFSSSENLKKDESSSIFNFSNYFGAVSNVIPPGSEILYGEHLLPTREG